MEAPRIITYSLLNGQKRSEQFYLDLTAFAAVVLGEGEERVGKLLAGFKDYIQKTGRESLRPDAEYIYELLTLGVLWRVYGSAAAHLATAPQKFLAWLSRVRKKNLLLKPLIDLFRGVLASLFVPLTKTNGEAVPFPTLTNLASLIDWLAATGDFNEEVKRFQAWHDYYKSLGKNEVKAHLGKTIEYASWFEKRSLAMLGKYTPNVARFLVETLPNYRWREDRIFCGRHRVEYHLTMVGAEIMNHYNRQRFLDTQRKLVILPPCMIKNLAACKAAHTPWGDKCQACTPGCRVNQVTKLGEKYGFDVLIMPDDLAVYAKGNEGKSGAGGSVGVIGVCCPLTVVNGHWQTRDLGVPAQGVLLDFCGCPWHWALDGRVITDINFNQLLRTLDLKK
ncbi:MAG: DUF116 domain-containing protein [Anaerolineales bacterium]|jgi:hypothetical protein